MYDFFFPFRFEADSVERKTLAEQRWSQAGLKLTHTSMHYDVPALLNICSPEIFYSQHIFLKCNKINLPTGRSVRNLRLIGEPRRFHNFPNFHNKIHLSEPKLSILHIINFKCFFNVNRICLKAPVAAHDSLLVCLLGFAWKWQTPDQRHRFGISEVNVTNCTEGRWCHSSEVHKRSPNLYFPAP